MLTSAGIAGADEDDPLSPEPADLASALIGYPRVHDRAEPGPADPRPDRGRLHPDLRRQAAGQDRRPSRARRAPDAQVRADPGGQRRVRGAAEDRDLTQLGSPVFRLVRRQAQALPDLLLTATWLPRASRARSRGLATRVLRALAHARGGFSGCARPRRQMSFRFYPGGYSAWSVRTILAKVRLSRWFQTS